MKKRTRLEIFPENIYETLEALLAKGVSRVDIANTYTKLHANKFSNLTYGSGRAFTPQEIRNYCAAIAEQAVKLGIPVPPLYREIETEDTPRQPAPPTYMLRQAMAREVGVSPVTLEEYARSGRLKPHKHFIPGENGMRRRYIVEAVVNYFKTAGITNPANERKKA